MIYVDGMTGVAEHQETLKWLYSLLASKVDLLVIVGFIPMANFLTHLSSA